MEYSSENLLRFKPRARIIRTIGDRLISGPEAAVIELVKNAYDADATKVEIKFIPPLKQGTGRIIVSDDGHGMSLKDITEKWMEPATTTKMENRESPDGRKFLGSKGIGRFATAKLGRKLFLETVCSSEKGKHVKVSIPEISWNIFDDNVYLEDIAIRFEEEKTDQSIGTILTISGLRETWTEVRLRKLHHELKRLISPIKIKEEKTKEEKKKGKKKKEFDIFLDLSECRQANAGFDGKKLVAGGQTEKNLKSPWHVTAAPLLTACDYEVLGDFDEDGHFSGTLEIRRGNRAPKSIDLDVPLKEGENPCGKVLVHFYIFDREADSLKSTMNRAGLGEMTAKQARAILDELLSGIAIYRNGFRIRPYGDPENDWLTLDTDRVQNPSMKIGNNQISGILVVDDEDRSGLEERSSREGFEENASFKRLASIIKTLLNEEVEPARFVFREKSGISRKKTPNFGAAYKSAKFGWLKGVVDKIPDSGEQEKAEEKIARESIKLVSQIEKLEERQAALEAKSSLGLIVAEVLHEGSGPVAYINENAFRLRKWLSTLFKSGKEPAERRAKLPEIFRYLYEDSEKLSDLFKRLQPLAGGKRGDPRQYNPTQIALDVKILLASRAQDLGVEFDIIADVDVDDLLGYKEDLAAALTNLADNALYWLGQRPPKNPKIIIAIKKIPNGCEIAFKDNGEGIPEEFRNSIFEVGFSLKPKGTGLGLNIAREALFRSNGTISLEETDRGATFVITLKNLGEK